MFVDTLIYAAIAFVSVGLVAQAVFTVGLMLYTWARPERLEESASPKSYLPPRLSFTAIMPARNEEGVIGDTLRQVWRTSYPKDLLEVVVVCEESDVGTIEEAQEAADLLGGNVRVLTFAAGDRPVNKPRGLNVALAETTNEVVTIFDAEDDVHPEIFNVINTKMQQTAAAVVQAGVQLMNFDSSWYSVQNVLEYFFYFKSRLHFHAQVGMIPLGGNTVFMRRDQLERVGGWDEKCLTEDADVGIRLSVLGEKIAVTYDAEHATREETPDTVGGFIKQRTRWCQGFFQVLRKGDWRELPRRGQRLLAFYTLTYPFFQAIVGALWIPAVLMMIYLHAPVGLAILSLLPLYAVGFQFIVSLVGLFDFARSYGLRVKMRDIVRFTLGFLPYQLLLSFSGVRAIYREALGATNWEKTAHSGAHRQPATGAPKTGASAPVTSRKTLQERPVSAPRKTAPRPAPQSRPETSFPVAGFERILKEASERYGAERGSVMSLEPEEDVFSIRTSRGLPESVVRSARRRADGGVAGWAVREKAAAIIRGNNAPADLDKRLNQPDLVSSVVLPVEKDGRLTVVNLSSKSNKLSRETLNWLSDEVENLLAGDDSYEESRRPVWKEIAR